MNMAKEHAELFDESELQSDGPVECLGLTFENMAARREHFLDLLREKLQDPEFRNIEGFPHGSDEDILALSDPPYYTACPNPFLEVYARCAAERQKQLSGEYHRTPYAAHLTESRNNEFVNAHSYATKVPHRTVMRLFLHYTEPDFLVLDGFAGTGMTGVAAQLCGDESEVRKLGYEVNTKGEVIGSGGQCFSRLGARPCVISDLGPAASYIAANFNLPLDPSFATDANRILHAVEEECGWMYKTSHGKKSQSDVTCTLWSDVFNCAECGFEFSFWDAAVK